MLDVETIQTAFENLRDQGWRSSLTVIGIVLGITAIITLISLGEGLNQSITGQFQSIGANTLTVLPGKGFADMAFMHLQDDDAKTIESVRGVDFAAEIFIQSKALDFKSERKTVLVLGIDPEIIGRMEESGIAELGEGRSLTSQDRTGVVIGSRIAEKGFEKELHVNNAIFINEENFKVIGINEKSANSVMGSFFDNAVIMNSSALEDLVGETIYPTRIMVQLLEGSDSEEVQERLIATLERKHGKEDFQVVTAQQAGQTAGDIIGIVQLVLVGIAAISLLVGAVGIMNTMFMSVTERTREIGVMKAVGATNKQVLSIFLAEALIIGLVGGVIGVLLGIGVGQIVSIVATMAGFELQAITTLPVIIFALVFSMLIGVISGLWPARTAAALDPIEALRQGE
ncbi:ABC transporter permease [Candidatus Micrarchaeota archaeon]|nr:ABC transporter permease [Candidatus Micrarchaeota archaeon]MBU1930450.1 ABC transporter permease [Candidatus Micrarchaeota archaeon]